MEPDLTIPESGPCEEALCSDESTHFCLSHQISDISKGMLLCLNCRNTRHLACSDDAIPAYPIVHIIKKIHASLKFSNRAIKTLQDQM